MARQAEKQLAKANVTKIALLRNMSLSVNAVFILVRLVWCFKSTTKKTWFMYIMTNAVACAVHSQLNNMGSPKYAADGSLKSSGEDLGQAGLTEYLTDLIYVTWIIYLLVALITDYAWLLYLSIPIYAVVKGWPLVRPMLQNARRQATAMQQNAAGQGSAHQQTGDAELSKRQAKLKARQDKHTTVRMR